MAERGKLSMEKEPLGIRLMYLQNVILTIRSITDENYREKWKEIDDRELKVKELERLKEEIEKTIPQRILSKFHSLMERNGKAIVMSVGEYCSNCLSAIPIGVLDSNEEKLHTCDTCGLFIFIP